MSLVRVRRMASRSTVLLAWGLCTLSGALSAAAADPHQAVADAAPGAPTNVTATAAVGFGGARVTWNAPSDGGSPITGYTVMVYSSSNQLVQKVSAGASATSSSVGNLTLGGTYTLTVQASNNLGSGPASSPPVSVTPVGCTSSLGAADRVGPARQSIAGWAFISRGYELSHATVSLWTLGGRRIPGASARTGPTGGFALSPLARELPRTFVVTVRGRLIGDRRLARSFAFSALVHRRDLGRIVYVGLASTVLLDYVRAHPRVSDGTAATRVRRALGIPTWHNLGYDLYNISPRWYSAAKVMKLAAVRGGMNGLVNALARKVRGGGVVRRPPLGGSAETPRDADGSGMLYPRQVQPYSSAWFMLNLGAGAVSAVGSAGAGWLFNAIGLNPTPSYIKTIEDQLNRLQAELEQLQDEVSALNVLVQQTYFAQQSNQLTDARSALDTAMEDEAWLANDTDEASQWHFSQVDFCHDIKPIATNDKPWGSTRVLFTNVLVNVMPPQKPLALQGAILLKNQGADYPFWTVSESQNVFEMADYWNQYAVEALDVYLEYEHGIGEQQYCDNPPTDAGCPLQNETDLTQKLANNVVGTLKNSQGTPLEPLPVGYTIDLRSGLMWCMFCSPVAQSYNAAVSGLSSGVYGGQPVLAFKNFKVTGRQQISNLLSGFTGGDRVKWLVDKAGLNPSWVNASSPNAPGHLYLWTTDVYSCGGKCQPAQYLFDLKTGSTSGTEFPQYSDYYLPARSIPKSEVYFPDQAP